MAIYLQVNRVHRGLTRALSADERSGRKKADKFVPNEHIFSTKLKIDAYSPRPELCRRKCLANTRMCVRLIDWSKLKNPNRRTTVVICLVLGLISITSPFFFCCSFFLVLFLFRFFSFWWGGGGGRAGDCGECGATIFALPNESRNNCSSDFLIAGSGSIGVRLEP